MQERREPRTSPHPSPPTRVSSPTSAFAPAVAPAGGRCGLVRCRSGASREPDLQAIDAHPARTVPRIAQCRAAMPCLTPGGVPSRMRPLFGRAVSSAVEHCLHTAGVTGSIPVSPTITSFVRVLLARGHDLQGWRRTRRPGACQQRCRLSSTCASLIATRCNQSCSCVDEGNCAFRMAHIQDGILRASDSPLSTQDALYADDPGPAVRRARAPTRWRLADLADRAGVSIAWNCCLAGSTLPRPGARGSRR